MSRVCKFCGSSNWVKNGYVHSVQRYKCKDCVSNFVDGDKRQKYTQQDRLKVIKLYLENCGIRSIERLTGIRNSQISLWIEETAQYIKEELQKSQNRIHAVQDISILEPVFIV